MSISLGSLGIRSTGARSTRRRVGRGCGSAARRRAPCFEFDDLALRVGDSLVIHPEQLLDEGLLDQIEIAKREVAFVELPIGCPVRHDPGDHAADRGFVAGREGSNGRFDAVGEHDQGGFAGLRLRTGVAVPSSVNGLRRVPAGLGRKATVGFRSGLACLGVEEADHRRSVVLWDEGDERLGQASLIRDIDAVGDVGLEHLGRLFRGQLVVQVLAARLVLDETDRVRELADVVVIGRHAGQERVGTNGLCRALGQVSDHQRVVIGPGRLDEQATEQGLRWIGEFQ